MSLVKERTLELVNHFRNESMNQLKESVEHSSGQHTGRFWSPRCQTHDGGGGEHGVSSSKSAEGTRCSSVKVHCSSETKHRTPLSL